jgi:hypothetical protein
MLGGVGATIALFACLVALGIAGCGTGERADDAAAVTESFHAALAKEDGQAACDGLTEEAVSTLERQEKKPCEKAILELGLPKGGTVADTRVEVTSAVTTLAQGGSDFLDEGPDGWKLSAAGCTLTAADQPYDCQLED